MSRLLTCGWETGSLSELGTTGGGGTESVASSTPTPRSPGTYCYKVVYNAATPIYRTFNLGAAKTDLWVRFGAFFHGGTTTNQDFLTFLDSTATIQGQVWWNPSDNFIRAYRGPGTTNIGTSVLTFSPDTWHTVDVRWQITSATVGIVEVWVDDTRWLNLTAVDNTNTATANVQYVRLGAVTNTLTTAMYLAFDDLAVNDTSGSINTGRIGEGRVVLLRPNGAGSNTGLSRGGTDTGANWSQTSEVPPSMTQYVLGATAALRDTYALQDVPAGSWAVNCCEVLIYAQNNDAGAGSVGLTVKSGSTTDEGTAQSLTTSAAYYRRLLETDPATTAAWTIAAVDALEAGVTVR